MKKLLLISLLLLVSCSKSDDLEDEREAYFREAIIGSWSYDLLKVNGETFKVPHTDGCERDYFQFYNQEGKIYEFEESVVLNCDNCAKCARSGTGLNWELKGNIIKMYFGQQFIVEYKIIEVTETSFTYERELDIDGDGNMEIGQITAITYDPFNDFGNN